MGNRQPCSEAIRLQCFDLHVIQFLWFLFKHHPLHISLDILLEFLYQLLYFSLEKNNVKIREFVLCFRKPINPTYEDIWNKTNKKNLVLTWNAS